ncbi:MAG: hypothetical protein KY461_13465 [Actinobacteria bacterium]|nr:hypothetical protein [Actinomycetota bacterium]
MKRILALVAVVPFLVAASTAETAEETTTPAPACAGEAGREHLGLDGLHLGMLAPAVAVPELAATHDVTGDAVTPYRTATFPLVLDVAPYASARLDVELTWVNHSDYDVYLVGTRPDGTEYEVGVSNDDNTATETMRERFSARSVDDCTPLRLEVRNWAGSPVEELTLAVNVTPNGDPLAGVGPREDTRAALYLAGDRPGQAGTFQQGSTGSEHVPVTTAFSPDRPTDNTPNQYTRALVGSDIERNLVQPFWAGSFDGTQVLQGQASAVVWLSSLTQQHAPGAVEVSLFVNGSETSVEIPGAAIGSEPRAFIVTFPKEFPGTSLRGVTLQVTTLPQASPNAASEDPGDAQHTVLYDSLQFQSALYLPTTTG